MSQYNIVAQTTEDTVAAEYTPDKRKSENYQSEAELEKEFIRLLCEQGYEYLMEWYHKSAVYSTRKKVI